MQKKKGLFTKFIFFSGSLSFSLTSLAQVQRQETLKIQDKVFNIETGLAHLQYYHEGFEQGSAFLKLKSKKEWSKSLKTSLEAFTNIRLYGNGRTTYSVKEAYLEKKISENSSLLVGRHIAKWSAFEKYQNIAQWNNAWDYNKIDPTREGLFGLFFKGSDFFIFASPLSLPNLTEHYAFNRDRGFEALSPWFSKPPEKISYLDSEFFTNYDLDVNVRDIVSKPQFGFSFDGKRERVAFKSAYYFGPDKNLDMAIDFALNATDPSTPVDVLIEPEISNVHKMAFDISYEWTQDSKTSFSYNYKKRNSALLKDHLERKSYIGLSSGGMFQVFHEQDFYRKRLKALFHFTENTQAQNQVNGELGQTLIGSLSVPFRFRRGVGLDLDLKLFSKWSFTFYNYYDFNLKGLMGSLKAATQRKKLKYYLAYNYIEPLNSSSEGFYKKFRENDSFRLGIQYAF